MAQAGAAGARRYRAWGLGLAVSFPILLAVLLASGVGGEHVASTVNNLGEALAAFAAAATCWFVGRRSSADGQRGWGVLAAGCGLWGVGQIIWSFSELVREMVRADLLSAERDQLSLRHGYAVIGQHE